ncbi:MAG: hypothetical protein ACRC8A_12565 [Microcoleaceae cyanobacterium]
MSKIIIKSGSLIKDFALVDNSHTIKEIADGIAEMIEKLFVGGIKEAKFEFDFKVVEEGEGDE